MEFFRLYSLGATLAGCHGGQSHRDDDERTHDMTNTQNRIFVKGEMGGIKTRECEIRPNR